MDVVITAIEKEIEELKAFIVRFAELADIHQRYADELPEAREVSFYWCNYYQEKECYCRQRLFAQEIELRKLTH